MLRWTTDCLSYRPPDAPIPIDFGYSSSFVETLDVPEIVGPHSACWLQSGTLELLKLNTSLMLEMDATSFWTLIQGCGHGRRWWPRGRRLSLSSLAMMVGRAVPEQTGRTDVSLGPHEYRMFQRDSRNLSGRLNVRAYFRSLRRPSSSP